MRRLLTRWWWLALLVPLGLGLARVRFDPEVLNLLPDAVPEVKGLKLHQQYFTSDQELLITVRAADAESAESAAGMIARDLANHAGLVSSVAWQPPWIDRPEQMAELVACAWLNQPPDAFARFTNRLGADQLDMDLAAAREQLATSLSPATLATLGYDPFGFSRVFDPSTASGVPAQGSQAWFASPDGTFRAVYVEALGSPGSPRGWEEWLARVSVAVDDCRTQDSWPRGVTLRYTGAPAFVAEIATGMERDLKTSAVCAVALIAGLFWWAYRSWRPLLWLLAFLGLTVFATMAAGGWIWGRINAVSMGFAAILLGLGVDYALVLYEEAVAAPQRTAGDLRRLLTPSILWSAITTAGAFGLLAFAGLPGLAQLGSLVAIGVLVAAGLMLYGFLPAVLRHRRPRLADPGRVPRDRPRLGTPGVPLWVTFVGLALAAIALAFQAPQLDPSTTLLQPKHCEAQSALDELESEMSRAKQPCLVVLAGADETDVADRLSRTATVLHQARADRTIQDYMLPEGLWPRPNWSGTNLAAAVAVAAEIDRLRSAARRAGFTEDAVRFAEAVTSQWSARAGARGAIWPTNQSARWILRRSAARTSDGWLAAGMLWGGTNATLRRDLLPLYRADAQTWVTGWPLLPEALLNHVTDRFAWLMAAGMGLVAASLRLAFHRWSDVLLSGLTIAFSLTILSALMGIAGWEWNLMTLMALPLLLGAGVDYTIHVQLALHRHGGDVRELRRITGRAVLLCAGTSVAGFGSNALSTNSGLAAMGAVCATGLAIVCLTAVFLLPGWWIAWHRRAAPEVAHHTPAVVHTPSALYHAKIWNLARTVAGLLPGTVAEWLGQALAASYARLHSARRRVVERNLLPACAGNPDAARQATRRLYSNFGVKMARLLRRETKAVDEAPPAHWSGWEVLTAAQARGQGVLLVTPHLGDWELGGYLLAQRGVPLLVLTQAEPGARLTEQRSRSRARWGIETLVVGQDPFAFVEILKRLQAGTVVALLLDRPAAGTDAEVELFGRPFRASSAAAELARASGCAVLPVYVIQGRGGTETHVLPEITYDRGQLGSREARRHLTQAIVRVFEPVIARHVDQWYHFIPIWPEPGA